MTKNDVSACRRCALRLLYCLAVALLATVQGRAHAQESQTTTIIGADASGAPCILSPTRISEVSEALGSGVSADELIRQLRQLRTASEATAGRPIPPCPPEMPALPEVALGYGTQHFDVRGWTEDLPVEELGALLEEIHAYVTERTGLRVEGLIPVMLQPASAETCPRRGRAWHSEITLFVDSSWSREQWQAVLAHELAHVLQLRESPGVGLLGGLFAEGYASWAAGRYWTDWQGHASFHAAVRDYLEREVFLELSSPRSIAFQEDPAGTTDCIAQRDILYTEWASLVEHLVESFGRDGFHARVEAAPEPGREGVDYNGIFDRSFEQIEADWLEAVRAQR